MPNGNSKPTMNMYFFIVLIFKSSVGNFQCPTLQMIYCFILYGLSSGFSQLPVFSMAAKISFSVTNAGLYFTSKVVVVPCFPALQLLTPFTFSTLAEIIFKSIEQVMPLTLTVAVFKLSVVWFEVVVCENAKFVVAVNTVKAKTNDFMNFIFTDFKLFNKKNMLRNNRNIVKREVLNNLWRLPKVRSELRSKNRLVTKSFVWESCRLKNIVKW